MTVNSSDPPQGRRAQEMFGSQAGAYATSQVHMYDDRLDIMRRLAGNASVGGRTWAMDLGSGTGFTAFVMAAEFKRVVASDITGPMLVETRRIGRERGLTNLALVRNAAEYLPFASGSLDLVTSRAAIHHFEDLDRALDELHRVLRPGGSLVVADSISPEDSDLSEWMNDIELRRDFSHVNNRPVSELDALLTTHGLGIVEREYTGVHLQFNNWVERTDTPEDEVRKLRADFLGASEEAVEAFQIQPVEGDINFCWPCLVFRSVKS